ncbi:MAG: hypothetical protein A4S09_14805 [Proteobacteria bacterium SG_bin7]|nr:MAG: hypothetical protein A4S09_14805 [Proteobacteria bacterium SG_bin7]
MKAISLVVFALTILAWKSEAAQRVRRVSVLGDQVVTVRTSSGIATIIQVPDRPNSVVVGDQNSFKVEYLDQAITIKPLSHGVKSNLYIYTDWRRFNVELISGNQSMADYVVYLDSPKGPVSTNKKVDLFQWTDNKSLLRNDTLVLSVNRLGRSKDGVLLVKFVVTSTQQEPFKPEWMWVTQSGESRPIHNLFMSSLEVTPQKSIFGVIQLQESDLKISEPLRVELRRRKTSHLTLQKIASWKR